ncbi:hypothetical protein [Chryseobacterium sp. IT-36CA2]|uniref:hypothetical protein n=1 Tax=Chryseobacterium sp. IT-36CA2 TaxID=3026460 RepID=UPI0039E1E8A5
MQKSDKNIVEQRIKEVAIMLINGNSREIIVLYCSENWNIGERQADKYIARAKTLVEKSVTRNINYDYAKATRRYEELYRSAIENKDYRLASSINKEIANLQGLYKIQIEHSGNIQFISGIPDKWAQ